MFYGKNVWYGERPLEKTFRISKSIGFDFVEYSIDYPLPEKILKRDFQILKNIRKDFGLEIAFHAPWIGLCLAHPQKEIFDASLKILKKAMLFSKNFNPLYFSFHIIAPFHGTFKLGNISREVLKKGVKAASEISALAKKLNLNVCVENNPEIFFGSPSQIEKVLNECKNLKFNFDISHAIVAMHEIKRKENIFRKEKMDLKRWFSLFKERIYTVHLSDVKIKDNEPKDHFPIGEGILNFKKIFSLIKKTKCENVVLEIFRKDKGKVSRKDFEKSLEIVKRFLND